MRCTRYAAPAKIENSRCEQAASQVMFLLVMLEILHGPLVFFRSSPRAKRAEIAALTGSRILLPRVEPILSRFQLADHDVTLLP
jgi:hypothetical protein